MDTKHNAPEDFSLSEGGPFYNAMMRIRMYNRTGKLALLALCITWLPLVIITAFAGTLYSGVQLPFLEDIGMQARLLLSLPILIMIRIVIDKKVIAVTKYLSGALMSPEVRDEMINTTFRRAKKLTSSGLTELILLAIVIAATFSFIEDRTYSGLESGIESWMMSAKGANHTLSFAGKWAVFISIPAFQFLLFRWLWRYFVWMLLLFRISRAPLNLLPSHADQAGGLGIIVLAQRNFNLVFVAGSVAISGQLIAQLLSDPSSFETIRNLAIGYIVVCIFLVLLPLTFFTGKLIRTKQRGLLDMSHLAADLSRKFEKEWLNDTQIEKRVEENQVDPSMIFDYAGMYDSLQKLRIIPVTFRDIITLGLTLFVPFIPILFIHFSVAELLKKILGLLI